MIYRPVCDLHTKVLLWCCEINGGYLIQSSVDLSSKSDTIGNKYIIGKQGENWGEGLSVTADERISYCR